MKSNSFLRVVALLALSLALLLPAGSARAQLAEVVPPADMFQLPWEQGKAWVALDGFDNGTKRERNSPHNYLNGGAVDFAPYSGMKPGTDTSSFWVTAAAAGTIIEVGKCHVKIDHGTGWISEYQFLGNIQVKVGDAVYRNQRLAVIADGIRQSFCLPHVDGEQPHLHFSVRPNMRDATFAGWLIEYYPLFNWTTYTRNGQRVGSDRPLINLPGAQIVLRPPLVWETLSSGSVDAYRYERWPFVLTDSTNFTLTATPVTNGLTPLLVLLNSNGQEIARDATGLLTATQPAGNYFVQVQPQAGQGFYNILLHNNGQPLPTGPYVYTEVSPSSIDVDGVSVATVGLGNVPAEGYTSTEFTCTYNASLAEASLMSPVGLFGSDPVLAVNGPQNGTFIVAIAGSKGNKATTSGPAFTFNLKGLQAGQSTINCEARISKGDGVLTSIPSTSDTLFIQGNLPGPTPTPIIQPSPTAEIPFITPTPEPEFSPTPTAFPQFCDQAEFVADVTVAPGTVVLPGSIFTKTWRLRNSGSCDWSTAYQLVFYSGDSLGAAAAVPFSMSVLTGQTVDLSINLTAPSTAGRYYGYWMLRNANGNLFGIGAQANEPLAVDITVAGPTTTPIVSSTPDSTPPVEPTFTPTPTGEATAWPTATPTTSPASQGILTGQVSASKTVTVILYNADNTIAASTATDGAGAFSLESPAGTYTVIATASGFLNAQGTATLTAGQTSVMPAISLWAGDIDGNNLIDQFDALTIGMNYNGALPVAADLNNDGLINVLDLELLAGHYRQSGPTTWQ